MDFVFDRVAGGRTIKCLVIVDDATHEAVAIVAEHSIGGDAPDADPGSDLLAARQAGCDPDRQRAGVYRARPC